MERFELARDAVIKAGEVLRQCHLDKSEVERKSGHQDLVTYWDRETEKFLRRRILSAFPQDSVVGEEYPPEEHSPSGMTWYLDPIDGTTNFINQHRNYAISVGCWKGGEPLFGMVLDVERRCLYWGKHGGGAWRNQTPIHVSDRNRIPELLVTTPGIQKTFLEDHPYRDWLIRLARDVRGVRSLGSVALELCEVAAGEADLFAALRSSPWDHNGARIILEEAGGAAYSLDGGPLPLQTKSTVLAVNDEKLMEELRKRYWEGQGEV